MSFLQLLLEGSPICCSSAKSWRLFIVGASSRRLPWRAAMQLNLVFLDLPNQPIPASKNQASVAWDQPDEAARVAALERLASLIARMEGAAAEETGHE